MDLRQLEIIRAIADTGSFTAAGEKLHVSQSAISRQILLLEEELGEPVFHRIGRRIRITAAGESLLQPGGLHAGTLNGAGVTHARLARMGLVASLHPRHAGVSERLRQRRFQLDRFPAA